MNGNLWLSFVGAKAVMSLMPGPAVMLVLAHGLCSHKRSLWAAAGILLANGLFFIVAAMGLGALFASSSGVFQAIKWISSLYLIYVGVRTLMGASEGLFVDVGSSRSHRQTCWSGALLQLSNPNAFIFFGAILPQFVDTEHGFVPQVCALGLTGLALDFLVLAAYGVFAARLGTLAASPRFRLRLSRIAGSLFIATGVLTAILR